MIKKKSVLEELFQLSKNILKSYRKVYKKDKKLRSNSKFELEAPNVLKTHTQVLSLYRKGLKLMVNLYIMG